MTGAPKMVTVIAPDTLGAGYTFPAQVDGINFTVTVPPGGVTKNQPFQVPYPTVMMANVVEGAIGVPPPLPPTASAATMQISMASTNEPDVTGRWRVGLCTCFDVFCNGLFWMSWCCHPILFGQLAQRLHLDAFGQRSSRGDSYKDTCKIVLFIYVGYVVLCLLGIGLFLWPFWVVYLIVLGMNIRYEYRRRYQIPPSVCDACDGRCDDCLCSYFCDCCMGIQIARHAPDGRRYPYVCGADTGLYHDAPDLVV